MELGAADYTTNAYLDFNADGKPNTQSAVALGLQQLPGSNALDTSHGVIAEMEKLRKDFPPGLDYKIIYNPTQFVEDSINEVYKTLFIALILVVGVVILFLQTWRAALIPVLAIPVSLIGHLRGDEGGGVLAQQSLVVRAGAGHRHRGRRRHRGGGERRAPSFRGQDPARGGAHLDGRGRRGADRHRAGADRGVRCRPRSSPASRASSTSSSP